MVDVEDVVDEDVVVGFAQGKSALWSHIVHFYDLKMTSVENKPVKASSQTPGNFLVISIHWLTSKLSLT